MPGEQESQQRKLARRKMQEAKQLFEGRHPERGVEAMREVLELDPELIEARRWLAEYYRRTGQDRLALSQYEEMLRLEPDNAELWDELRSIDPATADRLQRLQHVAPDPFVAQRAQVDMSDLEDFEDEDEEFGDEDEVGPAPFRGATAVDDVVLGDEEETIEAAGPTHEVLPWEHEQEVEYREALDNIPAFADVLDGLMLFWQDPQGWSHLVGEARAGSDAGWPQIDSLAPLAAGSLKVPPPSILVFPGRMRLPLALPLQNPTLVVGESYRMALTDQETLFLLGFGLHGFRSENAECFWAAEHVIGREAAVGDLRRRVTESAGDFTVGWEQSLPRAEIGRLAKIAHAWEQRAVLSADRAGLLACRAPDAACRTIAAMTCKAGDEGTASADDLLAQFEDTPPGELAAIGLAHDPWTDPQYAAYRIQMLRWWATTDGYKQLG